MAELSTRERIARGFSAAGAALLGHGAEFQASIAEQDRFARDEEAKQLNLRRQAAVQDLQGAKQLLDRGDFQGALELGNNRLQVLSQIPGADPSDTAQFVEMLGSGDAQGASQLVDRELARAGALESRQQTVQQAKFIPGVGFAQQLSGGGVGLEQFTPEQQDLIKVAEQRQIDLAAQKAGATTSERGKAKIQTERGLNSILAARKRGSRLADDEAAALSGFIDEGIAAFDQKVNVERGLELLKEVNTGGLTARSKAVTDFFGTTSGDIGELNNILAQNVLEGLSAFTGAISEGERAFIERMQTGISQGTEVNRRQMERLSKMLDRKVGRAKDAAKATGNEFALNIFAGGTPEAAAPSGGTQAPSVGAPTVTSQAQFDALPSGSEFIENGQRFRKP